MKNLRHNVDDLRPEYRRSDFGELTRGKYAYAEFEFADIARAFVVCIGEDEGLNFTSHSQLNPPRGHKPGDWTYEIDHANQIRLQYWVSEFRSIEEVICDPPACVTTPQERTDLQNLLTAHFKALKAKVAAL
jgi:hypothetical protein